jgi:hypothetical protein
MSEKSESKEGRKEEETQISQSLSSSSLLRWVSLDSRLSSSFIIHHNHVHDGGRGSFGH